MVNAGPWGRQDQVPESMDNALYVGLSRQMTLQRQLDIVANNIANADTSGFKAEEPLFRTEPKAPANTLDGPKPIKFVIDAGLTRDFSQGPLRTTNAAFDLAIDGPGFFRIQTPSGERFTRDGHFRLDETGRIVTQSGQAVLDSGGAEVAERFRFRCDADRSIPLRRADRVVRAHGHRRRSLGRAAARHVTR